MAAWKTEAHLRDHFENHWRAIGAQSLEAYDASAQETLDIGTYFEYEDPETGEYRLGCYDQASGRFTALDADDLIVTHFRCRPGYVRRLPHSNYDG